MVSRFINKIFNASNIFTGCGFTFKRSRTALRSQVKEMKEWLETLRVSLSLLFLMVSSWYDFKTREVPNRVWVFFAPIGLALTFLQFYLSYLAGEVAVPVFWLLSFAVTTGISLVLFYAGLFGGADAKALICLSIALPVYPSSVCSYLNILTPFFPLAVLSNAVIGSSLVVLVIASYNLLKLIQTGKGLFEGLESEPFWSKILAFMTGFKVDFKKLKNKSQYTPLECFSRGKDGEIIRHLRISIRLEDETSQKNVCLDNLPKELKGKIWATPGLPFLIFVTAGFVSALLVGDFVTWLVSQILTTNSIRT
jgi:preflagellin peptidase FlaK